MVWVHGEYIREKNKKMTIVVLGAYIYWFGNLKMVEALQERYREHIFKSEIRHTSKTERGVFATEDIDVNDVILKLPIENVMQGSHVDLTYRLMKLDNDYSRSLPATTTNFPVFWTDQEIASLGGSALQSMIPSRKAKLLAENTRGKTPSSIFLYYRSLVGSRAFTVNKSGTRLALVPYADMLNHSITPNTDWKLCDEWFVLKATAKIPKNAELYDSYGVKTNYEACLFYGMVLKNNLQNDITYEMFDIPTSLRQNLNYDRLQSTVEFELCGSYSRGTTEIFSLVRFLTSEDGSPQRCPSSLHGLNISPSTRENEMRTVTELMTAFQSIYDKKVVRLKDATGKVAHFAGTELSVLLHWVTVLKQAQEILAISKQKAAKKAIDKYEANDYLNLVIRKLVNRAKNYK